MNPLFRSAAFYVVASFTSMTFAQELDDLFSESESQPPCECHHHDFRLEHPPEWMPKKVKAALVDAGRKNDDHWQAVLFLCPTTNAVIERSPLKRVYRFLVCPTVWQGFKPKKVDEETLIQKGTPIKQIREMFQGLAMGLIEVSFRAHPSQERTRDQTTNRD